jgi:hypothetical protein
VVVYRDVFTISGVDFNKYVDLGDKAANGMYMVRVNVGDRSHMLKFITSR